MRNLPEKLYSAASVRELDRRAIEDHGIEGYELMTRAGRFAFDLLAERWPEGPVTAVCGAGNNAGDGYVIARLARQAGRPTVVLALVDPGKLGGDAARAMKDYRDAGGEIRPWEGGLPEAPGLVVDALLGTGIDRNVEGRFAEAVEAINASGAPVLAVDIPSGLHADTGRVMGVAVGADLTPTFIGLKAGLLTGRGPALAGELRYGSLNVPEAIFEGVAHKALRLRPTLLAEALPRRPRDAHKGLFGHVLVIGGGPGMPGAARMAGEAALRAGAGLVTVATLPEHVPAVAAGRPELMCRGIEDAMDLEPLLERATVVALGPGLGLAAWSKRVFEAASAAGLPTVLDADGLNLLAESPDSRADRVITPHPGEAARLLGTGTGEVQADRFAAVDALAERYGSVAVLKGAGSLVRAPGGETWLCDRGNPGMAVAGMGDVLTGLIAGVAAQCGDLVLAARVGVLLHALAGDQAAAEGERGMIAGDLFPPLRRLVNGLP